jgi:hypothetical protein
MEETDQELEDLLHYLNLPGALWVPVRIPVRFGLDGTDYEIDLNAGHSRALPGSAGALCACGTTGREHCTAADPGRALGPGGLNSTEVRERAKAQGIEVKDRRRVPAEVVVTVKTAAAR